MKFFFRYSIQRCKQRSFKACHLYSCKSATLHKESINSKLSFCRYSPLTNKQSDRYMLLKVLLIYLLFGIPLPRNIEECKLLLILYINWHGSLQEPNIDVMLRVNKRCHWCAKPHALHMHLTVPQS
jgi:hypothetical protein